MNKPKTCPSTISVLWTLGLFLVLMSSILIGVGIIAIIYLNSYHMSTIKYLIDWIALEKIITQFGSITNLEGPYTLDLKQIFLLPTDLILDNLDVYWKARITVEARKVLCEKIQRFFTRLPFDDLVYFTKEQIIWHLRNGDITINEVSEVLTRLNRDDELAEIISIHNQRQNTP